MPELIEVRVEIPHRPYSVWVGPGALEALPDLLPPLAGAERAWLLTDAAVAGLHGARALAAVAKAGWPCETFTLEPGEQSKGVEVASAAWSWLAASGAHRRDPVIALGGGVVGDVAGFVAATYARGMPFVQVPTTLLAQVDAAVGGKTAIDIPEGKNLVGAFHQPSVVAADTDALLTLPDPVFATGMAEVIKHALLAGDPLLARLREDAPGIRARDAALLPSLVAEAVAVKAHVVAADERESGERAFLNYGHTLAHALEAAGGYTQCTHGEAVAIGMMFVAHLGARLGFADLVDLHRELLAAYELPVTGARAPYDEIATLWVRDKKYEQGMRFVVLEDVGRPQLVRDVADAHLRAAYEAVR